MTTLKTLAILTVLSLLIPAAEVCACQCGSISAPREAMERSDVVVAGVVSSIKAVTTSIEVDGKLRSVRARRVQIKVQRVWKGNSGSKLQLVIGVSNCDYRFTVGKAFLVYADRVSGATRELTATICKPTKPFSAAQEDLEELGPGSKVGA
jgi:hypothetical protein